jgi:hypothetical protein
VVWGRVPLPTLVSYFQEYCEVSPKEEYVDLGTPLFADAALGGSLMSNCENLLRAHPLGCPKVAVAIVDEGCRARAPAAVAEDFSGRLRQIQPHDLVMSRHAVAVLWTLIERLNKQGILDRTELYCALVPPATSDLGSACFTHGNSPEMLSALKMLGSAVNQQSLPVVINMSMGTHVGPHNGDSPLESYVRTLPYPGAQRYLVVAAGNDGLSGVSGSCSLSAGQPDFLRIRTQSPGSGQILVEFWWRQADGGNLTIDVEAQDGRGASLIVAGSLRIDSATATGVQLTQRTPYSSSYPIFSTLFHANCQNGMSCIAFAMTPKLRDRPQLHSHKPGRCCGECLDCSVCRQKGVFCRQQGGQQLESPFDAGRRHLRRRR